MFNVLFHSLSDQHCATDSCLTIAQCLRYQFSRCHCLQQLEQTVDEMFDITAAHRKQLLQVALQPMRAQRSLTRSVSSLAGVAFVRGSGDLGEAAVQVDPVEAFPRHAAASLGTTLPQRWLSMHGHQVRGHRDVNGSSTAAISIPDAVNKEPSDSQPPVKLLFPSTEEGHVAEVCVQWLWLVN
jgi:hypothetical protein